MIYRPSACTSTLQSLPEQDFSKRESVIFPHSPVVIVSVVWSFRFNHSSSNFKIISPVQAKPFPNDDDDSELFWKGRKGAPGVWMEMFLRWERRDQWAARENLPLPAVWGHWTMK